MKKSLFLSLLLIGGIALAGCQKSNGEPEVSESKYPVAEQVCADNGGEVTVDEEGKDICLLGGRAIYLADMEEQSEAENEAKVYCEENGGQAVKEEGGESTLCMFKDGSYCEVNSYYKDECGAGEIFYNTLDDENVDFVLPEGAKTSLTSEELDEIAETNFPKGYTYSTFHMDENLIGDEGDVVYPEDFSHTLLIPDHATMASREVLSSGIEDGMIYTLTKVTLQDGTEIEVLYINDPVTLNFVAASVENGNITTNYQFAY